MIYFISSQLINTHFQFFIHFSKMVKNVAGGCNGKKVARKHTNKGKNELDAYLNETIELKK